PEFPAAGYRKAIGRAGRLTCGRGQGAGDPLLAAAGRVEHEALAVDFDPQVAVGNRDPLQDLGQRVGLGGDPRRDRVDPQRVAHDDVAEVEGTGLRRDLDDERVGRSLIWTAEVDRGRGLAGLRQEDRLGARAGADNRAADLAGRRAVSGSGGRAIAERYALQLRQQALGQGRLDPGEVLL